MAMTKKELTAKIDAVKDGLDRDTIAGIVCALIGHSSITNSRIGELTCARCGAIVGDTLQRPWDSDGLFIIGCGCSKCKAMKLGWRDKYMVDDGGDGTTKPKMKAEGA